jgi:hypothetical protein
LNFPAKTPKIHGVADHQNMPRLSVVAWALLACPLFGVGVAFNAVQAGWISTGGQFMVLLFAVPAWLTLLTAALSQLSRHTMFSLATSAAAIAGTWLVVVLTVIPALSS